MGNSNLINASHWYAVRTKAKQEQRAESNLNSWRVETFAPKMKSYQYNLSTGKPTALVKSLFPGYIFARFKAGELLHKVNLTRGVQGVICFDGVAAPVDDEIIANIKSRIGADGCVMIGDLFKAGDKVKIKDGPLKDFNGIFERHIEDSSRVMILLTTINYQARIVIERELIKPDSTGPICAARPLIESRRSRDVNYSPRQTA